MTDRTKFEAMLEALINEDHEAAKDIFHNIVVGKSREIYEKLLAEEFGSEEEDDAESDDPFGSDDEEGDDEEGDDPFGSDDEEGDEFDPDEGDTELDGEDDFGFGSDDDEEGDEFDPDEGDTELGDLRDEVFDLKDQLADLQAEFEELLAGEENEPEHGDMFGGDDDMGDMGSLGDEEGMPGEEEDFQNMFEYVNKVALPKHGDDGLNNKSIFNKPKYNDMGGTTANIVKSFSTESGGTKGGLLSPETNDLTKGMQVHNRKDSNAGKKAFKSQQPGHGAEKAGKRESAPNTKSLIPGRK